MNFDEDERTADGVLAAVQRSIDAIRTQAARNALLLETLSLEARFAMPEPGRYASRARRRVRRQQIALVLAAGSARVYFRGQVLRAAQLSTAAAQFTRAAAPPPA